MIPATHALENCQPIEVTLVELVMVLAECTEDVNEIFATVDHMVERGSVRLTPMLCGGRIPEAC